MRYFYLGLAGLLLSGCEDTGYTEADVANQTHKMYQLLCDGRQPCLDQLSQTYQGCQHLLAPKTNLDTLPFDDPHMGCVVEGLMLMDDAFKQRFDQMFPVTETGVTITRGEASNNRFVIRLEPGQATLFDQTIPLENLMPILKSLNVAERYSGAVIELPKNGDTGDLIEAMDAVKNAGVEDIAIKSL